MKHATTLITLLITIFLIGGCIVIDRSNSATSRTTILYQDTKTYPAKPADHPIDLYVKEIHISPEPRRYANLPNLKFAKDLPEQATVITRLQATYNKEEPSFETIITELTDQARSMGGDGIVLQSLSESKIISSIDREYTFEIVRY